MPDMVTRNSLITAMGQASQWTHAISFMEDMREQLKRANETREEERKRQERLAKKREKKQNWDHGELAKKQAERNPNEHLINHYNQVADSYKEKSRLQRRREMQEISENCDNIDDQAHYVKREKKNDFRFYS